MRLGIRSQGLEIDRRLRELIERKLRFVLGRFGSRIIAVTVNLAALGGQRDMDMRCRIVVRLTPTGRVCFAFRETDPDTALNRAVERIGPAISRDLMRRRDERRYLAR